MFELRPGRSANPSAPRSTGTSLSGRRSIRRWTWPTRGAISRIPFFRDGTRKPAGQLLEQVGAKEARVGGAAVYSGHANFLYNAGNATARDVLALAALLKKRVRDAFGIDLEEEVIALPSQPLILSSLAFSNAAARPAGGVKLLYVA